MQNKHWMHPHLLHWRVLGTYQDRVKSQLSASAQPIESLVHLHVLHLHPVDFMVNSYISYVNQWEEGLHILRNATIMRHKSYILNSILVM